MRRSLLGPTLVAAVFVAACSSSLTSPSANQLQGPVQSITPPTLNVGGQVVTTTGTTVVRRGGTRIDLSRLHLGEPVRVHGEQQANDTLMAEEIDADENEIEFRGTVDSIVAPKIWVNGRTVVTDSATRITRGEDTRVTLADLKMGDTVKVEGAVQADSTVLAHRIEVGSEGEGDGHEGDVELRGPIDSIAAPDVFVSGRKVATDSTTIIERGDTHLRFADLTIGDTVQVEGVLQPDSSVLARRIEVGREEDGQEEGQGDVRGAIDSIVAANLFVGGQKVVTDSATTFVRGDQHITLGDLHAGDTVEVEGVRQSDHSVLARKVEVVTGEGDGGA